MPHVHTTRCRHRAGVADKLKRFARASGVTRDLTPSDFELFQLLDNVRLADSRQLKLYLAPDDNHRAFLRRLQTLYHAGYLDRPRNQLSRRFVAGGRFYVYGLGEKGLRQLLREDGADRKTTLEKVKRNNENIQARAIDHRLAVTEALLTFNTACHDLDVGLSFYEGATLRAAFPKLPKKLTIADGDKAHRVPLYPDALFVVTPPDQRPRFFFLEADRGTETMSTGFWERTSIRRKLVLYSDLHLDGRGQVAGVEPFRVLTVTTTEARRDTMRDLANKLEPRTVRGLFLFATDDALTLEKPTAALTKPVWFEPREDSKGVALLD